MRVIQFELPGQGRRVGVVDGEDVIDLTSSEPTLTTVYRVFEHAQEDGLSLEEAMGTVADSGHATRLPYSSLLEGSVESPEAPHLLSPIDHDDPHHVLISGTGLTHTGSMESRDKMHAEADALDVEEPATDSAKMFQMGIEGGKPSAGVRGTAPEWFHKGNGTLLRAPGEALELPAFVRRAEPRGVECLLAAPSSTQRHSPRLLARSDPRRGVGCQRGGGCKTGWAASPPALSHVGPAIRPRPGVWLPTWSRMKRGGGSGQ